MIQPLQTSPFSSFAELQSLLRCASSISLPSIDQSQTISLGSPRVSVQFMDDLSLSLIQAIQQSQLPLVMQERQLDLSLQNLRTTLQLQSNTPPLESATLLRRSESLEWIELYLCNQNRLCNKNQNSVANPYEYTSQPYKQQTQPYEQPSQPKQRRTVSFDAAELTQPSSALNEIASSHSKKYLFLDLANSICTIHQASIQALLQNTQQMLTSYFSSINDPKKVHIETHYPTFLAMPITYAHIQAAATKAFTDQSYAKDYPRDGCYARAELAAIDIDMAGNCSGKIFITESDLCLQHPTFKNIAWNYHVAAAAVSKENNQVFVIDPCISHQPILLHHWLERFVVGDSVKLTFTHASYHYTTKDIEPNPKLLFERTQKAKTALVTLAKTSTADHGQS